MLRLLCLAAAVISVFGVPDFDQVIGHGDDAYEFVFHDRYNLLLVIHDNGCYYAYMNDYSDPLYLGIAKQKTEQFVKELIKDYHDDHHDDHHDHDDHHRHRRGHDSQSKVRPSSMAYVRDKFQDLLADFRCSGKNIYTIELHVSEIHLLG